MEMDKKKLMDLIEPILFNEKELLDLKDLITDVGTNKIEPRQLRKAIIDNRVKVMKQLIDTFFFQVKREISQQEINNFTKGNSQLKTEVEEKDRFLEQIAERIQAIYAKALKNIPY
ncbi:hypothetical protein LCGC14_3158210 [marine sediment metagenome]|uniref:Uncharacterized protein n=1 Tax=marine sediment metagenome TaxID=412755 RepID=A0A0F8XYT8_9ZZZZ